MQLRRFHRLTLFFPLLLTALSLVACSTSGIGTIPSGTPNRGNGTPAVIPTAKVTAPPAPKAPADALGPTYAFVRNNQLWVALNGAAPVQATHFDYTGVPNIFWNSPLWSSDDHFIAFTLNALPVGLGGGGCPGPDYRANEALYLLNTTTLQLTQLLVPADANDTLAKSPHNGYWRAVFWEDPTHVLAWYNGIVGKTSNTAGLYRYDLNNGTLAQVIVLNSLIGPTVFNVSADKPQLLSLRYSSEQLFYQVVTHPLGQSSQLLLYRHSVTHPEMPSGKIVEMGSEPWCAGQQSGPFIKPGWDISLDGSQLVVQMVMATGPDGAVGSVQVLNMQDGSKTQLFAQVPSAVLGHDLALTWGADNQTVAMTSASNLGTVSGPYSATLANPAALQQYMPQLRGQVTWRSDSSAFALSAGQTAFAGQTTGVSNVYLFLPSDMHGRLLLADTQNFAWG